MYIFYDLSVSPVTCNDNKITVIIRRENSHSESKLCSPVTSNYNKYRSKEKLYCFLNTILTVASSASPVGLNDLRVSPVASNDNKITAVIRRIHIQN